MVTTAGEVDKTEQIKGNGLIYTTKQKETMKHKHFRQKIVFFMCKKIDFQRECVCVCVRERESERERGGGEENREGERQGVRRQRGGIAFCLRFGRDSV